MPLLRSYLPHIPSYLFLFRMKRLLLFLALCACVGTVRAQLRINEISNGSSGSNKEYVEFVVVGSRTCTDSTLDMRGVIFDDNPGWYDNAGIATGCYRFSTAAAWSAVPYGSLILVYNAGDKNTSITAPDDPTDANGDNVYIVPSSSALLEISTQPVSGGTTFDYSTTAGTWAAATATSWVSRLTLTNSSDAFHIVVPSVSTTTASHSLSYGPQGGGNQVANITFPANAGTTTVFYNTGSAPLSQASWTSGAVPAAETPGTGNSAANTAWIAAMKVPGATGGRLYVDGTVATSGTGASWATAKKRLEEALLIANTGTCVNEIWVADGTYFPTTGAARDSSFRILRNGIKVYGGFAGAETLLSQRNILANPAILSGNIALLTDSTDNAYHVVTFVPTAATPMDTTTALDGFTITGGYSAGATGAFTVQGQGIGRQDGAGMYLAANLAGAVCSPRIENCTIRRNVANYGGGMYGAAFNGGTCSPLVRASGFVEDSAALGLGGGALFNTNTTNGTVQPVFLNCSIAANRTSANGAGIYMAASAPATGLLTVRGSTFTANRQTAAASSSGGAVFLTGNTGAVIRASTFVNNFAASFGAAVEALGIQSLTVDSCTFTGNSCGGSGAALDVTGANVTVTNSTFTANKASFGTAIERETYGTMAVSNCRFANDTATTTGAAIRNTIPDPMTIDRCLFIGNYAGTGGGAIENVGAGPITVTASVFSGNIAAQRGGALLAASGSTTLTNCVFAGNSTTTAAGAGGGAIQVVAGTVALNNSTLNANTTASTANPGSNTILHGTGSTLALNNSIVWGTAAQHITGAGTSNAAFSNVKGLAPAGSNLSIDPVFINPADPDGADNTWATTDDGLRLDTCSPAINAGSNPLVPTGTTNDITGVTARILNTTVDMGAYEHPYSFAGFPDVTITASPAPPYCTSATIIFTAASTNGGVASYQWFVNSTSVQAGANTTFTTSTLANNDTVWVVLTNLDCGYRDTSNRIMVPVTSIPVAPGVITGATTPCVGSSQTYTIAAVPGATSYTWTVPAGWTGGGSTTTVPSFTSTVGNTSGNVTVTANTSCGASAASILAVTVQQVPGAPGTITGPAAPCVGTTQTYSVTSVAGVTYAWTLPGAGWSGTSPTATLNATVGTASGNIQVTASNACGPSAAAILPVAPAAAPAAPGPITGNTAPCAGTSQTYSITSVPGATTYTWTVPAGWNITAGAGTPGITATPSSAAGNITVTAGNICGTSATNSSLAVAPTGTPVVPGVISGNATPCVNSSQTYTIAAVPGATSYTWTVPGGGGGGWTGNNTTTTTPSFATTVGAASGAVQVTAASACGTSAPSSFAVTVQQAPSSPGTIAGPPAPCAGTTQTYSVTSVAGVTYAWTLPGAGWSGTSPTATLNATVGTASGNIKVKVTNVCGADSALLAVAPVSAPPQPGAITGNAAPCAGTSQTYSVTVVPGATMYNWSLPTGWTTGGSTTNTITVTPSSTAGAVSVTVANVCGTSATASTLAVTPSGVSGAPGAISGNASICSGTQNTYSISPILGAATYNWSMPAGWTSTSNANTLTTTASATSGSISVTVTNTCGTSTASTFPVTVTVPPATPGTISGPAAPCVGTPQTYSVAAVSGATSFIWTLPGTGWAGTSSTATLNATVGTASGTMTVAAVNGCGTSTASNLAVTPNNVPAQPGVVAGAAVPCIGVATTYSIGAVANSTSYTWTVPTGWAGGASTTTSVSTTPTAASGTVTVVANNACGQSFPRTLVVTPITTPAQPGTMTVPAQICQGTAGAYSVPNVATAASYTWTLPTGWSGNSTSSTIIATPNATSGTISVTATNACGASPARTATVTVTPLPVQPSGISGPSPVCAGTAQTYTTGGAAGATSYAWTLPPGWNGASTTGTISATAGSSGTVSVTAANVCGTSTAAMLPVTVNPLTPTTASITATTPTTVCPGVPVSFTAAVTGGGTTPSFTWTRNGSVQSGITGNTFTVSNPVSGDVIGFSMASSAVCPLPATAIALPITITVLPSVVPGININTQFSTAPIICTGTQLNFIANIVGGGTAPTYQWWRNGVAAGTNAPTYSASGWTSGETVYAKLTSNAQCATPATMNSNVITVTVNPTVAPTVFITASPSTTFVQGQTVTFTANVSGGGAAPTFEWLRNNQLIQGAFGPVYATSNLTGNDTISVRLTSGDPCASPTTALADPLVTTMIPTSVTTVAGAAGMSLYPNPNEGRFMLAIQGGRQGVRTGIEVLNALGQVVYFREVITERADWTTPVELTDVANGVYLLRLRGEDGSSAALRFEVRK